MVINRIIDNAAVAAASVNRRPVASARAQALAHPLRPGRRFRRQGFRWSRALLTGMGRLGQRRRRARARLSTTPSWPPITRTPATTSRRCWPSPSTAAHRRADLLRAIAVAYEIQIDLVRAICLHEHKNDHVAHLGPSVAAGLGTLLGSTPRPSTRPISRRCTSPRDPAVAQGRDLELEGLRARRAPASSPSRPSTAPCAAKTRPSPIYEGEDGVIAWLLGGPRATYQVPLPAPGEPRRAILDTYTKEHSAEYQSQALIDLAFRLREATSADLGPDREIVLHTSHHTHYVIGTGSTTRRSSTRTPAAKRSTTRHVHLRRRACRTASGTTRGATRPSGRSRPDTDRAVAQDPHARRPEWTRRYHATDPRRRRSAARVEITLTERRRDRRRDRRRRRAPVGRAAVRARAVRRRSSPSLTDGRDRPTPSSERFLDTVERCPTSQAGALGALNLVVDPSVLDMAPTITGDLLTSGALRQPMPAAQKRAALPRGV